MALSQLYVVMIGVFPADRDHMGGEVRCRVPAWRQRVGDDLGALARRDLEKVVAEILNDGLGRVRDGGETSGYMQVSTSGFTTSGPKGNQEEGQNRQRKIDMSQHPTSPQLSQPAEEQIFRIGTLVHSLYLILRSSLTHVWHSLTPPLFWTMMRAWSSSRQQWSILARPQGTARRYECGVRFFWCLRSCPAAFFQP